MAKGSPVALVALLLLAGCSGESDPQPEPLPPPVQRGAEYEERVIRGWLLALERDDYVHAAEFFAPNALIDQGDPYRLKGQSDARIFNASLPCRAELVDVADEPGPRSLATFSLREGPGGECTGRVKVRFTIVRGKFTVWRQFPEEPEPAGPVV
jgi:hypothetical protein